MTKKKQDPTAALRRQVEELTQQVAELRKMKQTPAKPSKGQPRPDVYYVLHGVPTHGLAPQAIACARILSTAQNVNRITEEEAMALLVRAKTEGRLKTKQDAWHIFQYYRPRLIEGDFLKMLSE